MTTTRQCYFKAAGYLLWMALLFSNVVGAATLHAIIVADTLDPEIKAGKDRDNIKKMVETVSQATNLKLNSIVLDGETITSRGDGPGKIRAAVNALQPGSDDVVLFYYAGHGVKDWQKGQWPALELQGLNTQPEGLFRLEAVKDILEKKPHRLLLVLADTCNKVDPVTDLDRGREAPLSGKENIAAYKALFLESRGSIIASGAIPGQNSNGNADGGYFTQGFLASLATELGSTNPSWETIMNGTTKWVQAKNPNQMPQAKVEVRSMFGGNDDINPPTPPPVAVKKLTVDKFDTNSAELKPAHKSKLSDWSRHQDSPEAKSLEMPNVTVTGHADSRGTEEHNLDLSRERADTVKDYLVKELGTDPDRLRIVPRGESQPVAGNETESGRALNRRVELIPESSARPVAEEQPKNMLSGGGNSVPVTTQSAPSSIKPLTLEEASCPARESSIFGTCHWGDDSEDDKKWSIFVEEKLWLNTWQGWGSSESGGEKKETGYKILGDERRDGALLSTVSDDEIVSIATLGFRYKNFSLGFSVLPKKTYSFPVYLKRPTEWIWDEDRSGTIESQSKKGNVEGLNKNGLDEVSPSTEDVSASAEREEIDITVGYNFLPQLQIGLGFKKATLGYTYHHYSKNTFVKPSNFEGEWPPSNEWNVDTTQTGGKLEYKTYGASLNAGGQVCLANWLNTNISIFGNFSYGLMKTRGPDGDSDPTIYHSTDLGLAFELPKLKRLKPEIRFGYRAQTMYTEIPIGDVKADAVDTTEGFTLGLRITY